MTHFALIAPPLRGHYEPLCVLADELISRGHRASFVHQREARELVSADGAQFEEIGEAAEPLARWTRPMARVRHVLDLHQTIKSMEDFTTMFCREAPAVLRRIKTDAVIADQLEPAGGLVADHLDIPFVTVATALPINREDAIPPPFVNWAYKANSRAVRRNRGGWAVTDLLLRSVNANIARNAERLGVGARSSIEDCFSPLLQLSQMSQDLDFPREALPQSFHYVGPLRRAARQHFLLPRPDRRRMVYASFGTLQGSRTRIFARIAEACAALDLRLVIAHGGLADEAWAKSLPGDPLIFDWVPQDAVMEQVAAVICHGGMNTTLDALLHGRPLLIVPLTFEQPGTAARVEHAGAGLAVPGNAWPKTFAAALRRLIDEPGFRARSAALGRSLVAAGGAMRAADLIDQALAADWRGGAATREGPGAGDARDASRNGSRTTAKAAS